MTQRRFFHAAALSVVAFALIAAPAFGITPKKWTHTLEGDFTGEKDGTVVTNHGDVKLARGTEQLAELPEDASVIFDMHRMPNGDLYIAAGPEARLYKRSGDKVEQVLHLKTEQLFSLDVLDGKLLLGLSGKVCRLAVLDGKELKDVHRFEPPKEEAEDEDKAADDAEEGDDEDAEEEGDEEQVPAEELTPRYIFDLLVDGKQVYVATGIGGRLYKVDTAPKTPTVKLLLDSKQPNILCLGRDKAGNLYAGTDGEGLLFRVSETKEGGEAFVLMDANEPEIAALVVLPDGTVYAGTADTEQATPGRMTEIPEVETGRPEPTDGANGDGEDTAAGDGEAKPDGEDGKMPTDDGKEPDPATDEEKADAMEEAVEDIQDVTDEPRRPEPKFARGGQAARLADIARLIEAAEGEDATEEQRDRLRKEIRKRLEKARRSGAVKTAKGMDTRTTQPAGARGESGGAGGTFAAASEEGNAVYRVDTAGFVKEVFRESVMILDILHLDGRLIIATGNEGQLYSVDLAGNETTVLGDLEVAQVTKLLPPDGKKQKQVILGTSNEARLVSVGTGFAREGIYTSQALDASQIARWGAASVYATIPTGASVELHSRSGNVSDPEMGGWSSWTKAATLKPGQSNLTPQAAKFEDTPPARFVQYRVKLIGGDDITPAVEKVELNYVVPNQAPRVNTLNVKYADPETEGDAKWKIAMDWEAGDPNEDQLAFTLQAQPEGSDQWLTIVKDHMEAAYEWNTRLMPDGRYVLRLTASDSPANPGDMALTARRRSDAVVIDNTAPTLDKPKVTVKQDTVTITGVARDGLLPIQSVHYKVNSDGGKAAWTPVLPDDLIFDSTSEQFTLTIPALEPGAHVVTIRVMDEQANALHHAVTVQVGK